MAKANLYLYFKAVNEHKDEITSMRLMHVVTMLVQVGTYHTASVRINLKPPTRGIVSRGIALEGFCSVLAGLWGSGTGSTTLTENVHTIDITKVASRRVVELGAVFLIFFSFIGKVLQNINKNPKY